MSAVSKRTRADQKELAERVAAVMRDAHVQLRLWGRCKNENCQRERNCCGDAEQCGARVAPASWAWLRDVVQRMLQGTSRDAAVEAANFARLGIRARRTVSWHVKCWDPIEFVQLTTAPGPRLFECRSLRRSSRNSLRWSARRGCRTRCAPRSAAR